MLSKQRAKFADFKNMQYFQLIKFKSTCANAGAYDILRGRICPVVEVFAGRAISQGDVNRGLI